MTNRYTITLPPPEKSHHVQFEVTQHSLMKYRRIVERFALYFKREFHYDFQQFSALDTDDYRAFLFEDHYGLRLYIGACCFRWTEWTDAPHAWSMKWVWVHPYFRGQGILTQHWPHFRKTFGDFLCDPPLSPAMREFLRKQGYKHLQEK